MEQADSERATQARRLYREPVDRPRRVRIGIVTVSVIVALGLAGVAFLLRAGHEVSGIDPAAWPHYLTFAIVIGIGPYGYIQHAKARRVHSLESRFPDFLRDVTIARRSGLTLASAVKVAARGDYGDLTPEIRLMAQQLDWNVSFGEAMARFADRVDTPLIRRTVALIEEAGRSGGSITDVIMAAAHDVREQQDLVEERRISMGLYVAIIYITFLVFLGVVAVMQSTFIPEVLGAGEAAGEAAAAGVPALGFSGVSLQDYYLFYYFAALAQGVGNGMVAGVIETGRATSGLRHSVAMALITWAVFVFLV